MIFTTWTYGLLLAIAVLVRFVLPGGAGLLMLLGLSLAFYAWDAPGGLAVLLPLLVAVHFVARQSAPGRPHARRWLTLGVTGCIGLLAYFKYQSLGVDALRAAGAAVGASLELATPNVVAPLGISFFIFLMIHYLVEVHRGNVAPASPRDEALFVAFFPTVVSGPLKRIEDFRAQCHDTTRPAAADLHEGLQRIVVGLSKKILVADQLAPFTRLVFASPDDFARPELWLAAYGYAIQIYFDFAGYSDIAIGSARLLGFRVPENFDYPYFRTNIAQFWRHWHMTLTGWIMQYVYFPLGGNRRGETRTNVNRLVAMTLCGLWHGSAFHFAVWGLYHGILLNLFQAYRRLRARVFPARPDGFDHPVARLASGFLTFHLVVIGWIFFAADLDPALRIIGRMLWGDA